MQDSKINGTLAIIGYVTASISVILTSIFMLKLGGDDKFLKGLFLVLGASLDVVKHILPIVIFYALSRKQWGFSAILSVVYCAMTVISFNASASTIEERITASLQTNTQSAVNLAKIEMLKKELDDKRVLFAEQKSANQVSKMDLTSDEISNLNRKIVDLMSNTSASTQESVLASQKDIIIYACAGLIEVFSLTIMLCVLKLDGFIKKSNQEQELLALLKNRFDSDTLPESLEGDKPRREATLPEQIQNLERAEAQAQHNSAALNVQSQQEVTKQDGSQAELAHKSKNVVTQTQESGTTKKTEAATVHTLEATQAQSSEKELLTESPETKAVKDIPLQKNAIIEETIIEEMSKALKNKEIKPNFRSVQSVFKMSRDEVRECLQILKENGILYLGKGNRYYVVEN
ncbi:hypothetical protein KW882_03850 [Vibrio parahaemolyticus]